MNFTASPSVQCSPASRISTVSVQVTQASQCSPFGSGSYSWTVLSPPTTSSAIIPVASGTSAIISCTGCWVYTITCFAYTLGIPAPCANLIKTIEIICPPTISVTNSAQNNTVCANSNVTLSASGANSYSWSNGASSSITVVSPSVSSCYSVTGIGSGSCTSATASNCINVSICTGISSERFFDSVSFYPNPTSNLLDISNNTSNEIYVKLIDLTGKEVFNGSVSKHKIVDVSRLSNGVYFIRFDSGKNIEYKKLVIER